MESNVNTQQLEVLNHIEALIEEHKRDINILYSELKLRLPSYLKSVTIQQLREAGATVDPDIIIPRGAEDQLRKRAAINEKFIEVRRSFTEQTTKYYENVKKKLPAELLSKQMSDLSIEEWLQLGMDGRKFKEVKAYYSSHDTEKAL